MAKCNVNLTWHFFFGFWIEYLKLVCIFCHKIDQCASMVVSLTSPSKALKNVKTHHHLHFLREDKWFFGKNWLCWSKNAVLMDHYHFLVSEPSTNYKKLVCSKTFFLNVGKFWKRFFLVKIWLQAKIPSVIQVRNN